MANQKEDYLSGGDYQRSGSYTAVQGIFRGRKEMKVEIKITMDDGKILLVDYQGDATHIMRHHFDGAIISYESNAMLLGFQYTPVVEPIPEWVRTSRAFSGGEKK